MRDQRFTEARPLGGGQPGFLERLPGDRQTLKPDQGTAVIQALHHLNEAVVFPADQVRCRNHHAVKVDRPPPGAPTAEVVELARLDARQVEGDEEGADPAVAAPWLRGVTAGKIIPAIALTEPGGGSDAANLTLRATKDGATYILDGEKTSTSFAAQAAFAIVWARTGAQSSGARGISAFLVPLDVPGIKTSEFDDLGGRCAGRGSVYLDRVVIPATHLLGRENDGFVQVMQGFDYSRALIGLQCLAVARQSLDETWLSTAKRTSFGKPLIAHQGVSFPLAEAETQLEACRLLCLKTLWLKDQGRAHTAEAAMCKWWAPKLAFDTVQTCLLLNGHGAYTEEMPYAQRLRDVLGLQIGDGTAQIMKLIIARHKAGRGAVPA